MREIIDLTLLENGKKYLLEPCCDQCQFNVTVKKVESFSGKVYIAYCPICGNYLKATSLEQKDK